MLLLVILLLLLLLLLVRKNSHTQNRIRKRIIRVASYLKLINRNSFFSRYMSPKCGVQNLRQCVSRVVRWPPWQEEAVQRSVCGRLSVSGGVRPGGEPFGESQLCSTCSVSVCLQWCDLSTEWGGVQRLPGLVSHLQLVWQNDWKQDRKTHGRIFC